MALDVLSMTLQAAITGRIQRNLTGFQPTVSSPSPGKSISFTTGAGAGQCNQCYCAVRDLAASANETLDLSGSLVDPVGNTALIFARVKSIYIQLLATTDTAPDGTTVGTAASSITIGAATNPFLFFLGGTAPTISLKNGAFLLWSDPGATGFAITGGTNDELKIVNADAGVIARYLICVLGSAT